MPRCMNTSYEENDIYYGFLNGPDTNVMRLHLISSSLVVDSASHVYMKQKRKYYFDYVWKTKSED